GSHRKGLSGTWRYRRTSGSSRVILEKSEKMVEQPPKVSIVIPNYNLDGYLERTICSVVEQEYQAKEVIVVDGNSTDNSHSIIDSYRDRLDKVVIEPDDGHADAINKGFENSTGEIMGWINSDDVLLPGCLENVVEIFQKFPEVDWIVGNSSHISDHDHLLSSYPSRPFSRVRFLMGDIRWVQQESTFWRRSLWEKAGSNLDVNLRLAVDFELWLRFSRHAKLYSVHVGLGAFRMRSAQRSKLFLQEYLKEVESVILKERNGLSQIEFERHLHLLQMPFMLRHKHEADAFGKDVLEYDLQPIRFDMEELDWLNPNQSVLKSNTSHHRSVQESRKVA
ncbi:MAG: glycosyltransferase family 2 protein, partial [Planctomycetota bacterium]